MASVQNVISANAVNGTRYPEKQMLSIFHGTCLAVRAMHTHQAGPSARSATPGVRARRPKMGAQAYPPRSDAEGGESTAAEEMDEFLDDDEEDEDEAGGLRSGTNEGQALIGGLESARQQLEEDEGERGAPGIGEDDGATVLGRVGDRQRATGGTLEEGAEVDTGGKRGVSPWAHRDIKPANIMLADDGATPVLMDFGSALPARIPIPDRRVALLQQDLAAEHCSMPFRAPELFDVKTGTELTEAVDIWSLGCTLFAMAYGTSPFETTQQSEHGGSIAMAAMGGKYAFPDDGQYSESFRDLVRAMVRVKPEERPDIQRVIELTEQALARLQ
ncbi:Serine/threonine-protein kinase env7 [Rhodotorula kratochvilovae]